MRKISHAPRNYNKIMLVGEAPGKDEDEQGKPFVGVEGQYLRSKCKQAGFNLNDCYVTNTVHVKPHKNKYYTLKKADLDEGRNELIKDINNWKPNIIIAVGAQALDLLTGKDKVNAYRGTVLPSKFVEGYKVFATIHPGYIFKGNRKYDIVLKSDLEKALEESAFPEIRYPERNIEVIDSISQTLDILKDWSNVDFPIAIDIETAGGRLVAYGMADSKKHAYVIPKELCENTKVLHAIGEFAKSSTPKIFHNALYDVFHNAYYHKILNNNIYFDTMLAEHAIFPTLPKSLAFCSSFYTNQPYWKEEGKEIMDDLGKNKIVDWPSFYIYNGKDCCLTYEIYEYQKEEIEYWQVRDTLNMMMSLIGPCLVGQMSGLIQDQSRVDEFRRINEQEIDILEQIKEATIGDINVNSSQQLQKLIYDQWDMPKQYISTKGQKRLTTSAEKIKVLERFSTPYKAHLGLIRMLKKHIKLRDFYNVTLDPDGRCRFGFKIHGAYTGRLSSSKSITGSGFNAQNQPKKVRKFYRCDPGKIFIQADLSNAEARIVAALTGDEKWLADFDKEDQHSRVAVELFGISWDQVNKLKPGSGKTYRDSSKQISHATHYLHGWKALSEKLACSAAEAKRHKENYFDLRPKLKDWHKWVNTVIRKERYIRTCFGRVIQFFGPNFDSMLTDAVAAEPQSTSVDYLNYALVDYYNQIPEFEFRQQGHDSVLCQVDDDLQCIENVMLKMKKITERPINIRGIKLTIPLDFEIGYYWGDTEDVKDINNLKEAYEKL